MQLDIASTVSILQDLRLYTTLINRQTGNNISSRKILESSVPVIKMSDCPGVPTADGWELDFSSRPVLDERGKKKWELLICSSDGTWRYSRYFPSNKINSTQVNDNSLEELCP